MDLIYHTVIIMPIMDIKINKVIILINSLFKIHLNIFNI